MVQLCSTCPSPFHVGKILIYAMPNAHYQKIDLNAPYTKYKKYDFLAKKKLFKTMSRLSLKLIDLTGTLNKYLVNLWVS